MVVLRWVLERNITEGNSSNFWKYPKLTVLWSIAIPPLYYAKVYSGLRKKGNPIPTKDIWIAATALQYNLALFSYEKHFRAVDGLITGNSSADFAIIRS